MEKKPQEHNLDRFQAWSREIIKNNQKKGSSTDAQKEKKNQETADILRARHQKLDWIQNYSGSIEQIGQKRENHISKQ